MTTEIQGLPPIVIQNFPELQNNIRKELADNLVEETKNRPEKAGSEAINSKIERANKEAQKLADFSDLSDRVQNLLSENSVVVQFSLAKTTKKMIMKLIDPKTKEVLHQYPPDIALKIARIVANVLETGHVTNAKF